MPVCSKCSTPISAHPLPYGRPGGKPAYFDWQLLRALRPNTEDSILVPLGRYGSLLSLAQAGRRNAREMGILVRATRKSTGVRFWRVA